MLTEEQRIARQLGVGASDSPIIMGFSSYKTPYQLYLEKIADYLPVHEDTELQLWGNLLEPVIRGEFERRNNMSVNLPDTMYCATRPYMLANLDGFIYAENAVLEIKTCNAFQRNEWGEDGSSQYPMQYLIQVAHQCIVTDCKKAYIAVLIGGNEYRQYEYRRDAELEEMIINAVDNFWLNNVKKRIEPMSITIEDTRIKYRNVEPSSKKSADCSTNEQLEELLNIRLQRKQLEQEEEHLKMRIMEYMKECECLTDANGKPVVMLKANAKGNRVFLLK